MTTDVPSLFSSTNRRSRRRAMFGSTLPVGSSARRSSGLPITALQPGLDEAERQGLLERDLVSVKPTERGFDFLNDLQALFLTD